MYNKNNLFMHEVLLIRKYKLLIVKKNIKPLLLGCSFWGNAAGELSPQEKMVHLFSFLFVAKANQRKYIAFVFYWDLVLGKCSWGALLP